MSSEKSSDDSQEPFEVYPEDSGTSGPLRFDPKDWVFVAEKERTEGWQTVEGFPEFIIEETIYQGDSDQWIIISARSCMIADLPIERTYKSLSNEEAAKWFIDCKGEVPKLLSEYMTSKSLTPEALDAIECGRPYPPVISLAQEITPVTFVAYWEHFGLMWKDIYISSKKLEAPHGNMQSLRNYVLVLLRSTEQYGRCKYRLSNLAPRVIAEWFPAVIPSLPMALECSDLSQPYDYANKIYRKMVPVVQSMAMVVSEAGESKLLTKEIIETCQQTADEFVLLVASINLSINESQDEELVAVRYARATKRLSQAASSNGNQEELPKPKWDGKKLFVGNALATEFRRDAKNQTAILESFQLGEWAERIDDPLPHPSDSQKLRETVASLNKRQDKIEFRCDGTGAGVLWSWRGRSADDKSF